MVEAVKSQFRILGALTIREMQSQNAKYQFGFAWALIEVLIYVAVISLLRVVIRAFMPPDMPPFTFLILGILPVQTFVKTAKGMEMVVARNKRLLGLPLVTPLDLALAKALQELCIYAPLFLCLAIFSSELEGTGMPRFPLGVVLVYLSSWLMGFSFGLILAPAFRMFPPSRWFFMPFQRVLFYTSGLYFVISSIPSNLWIYMTWNPLLHVDELMRTYWFSNYVTPVGSPGYILMWMGGMTILGLSLERFIRTVPP
jgi:capsular polysaccharide transport system permease protein